MALPTIIFNSSTGSDTAASGAGPATALTGSSASTSGTGLVVTLDGSPDLSGVATDGSHVLYLADSTAGARNFGKITGKDDGADTVTVANAFGLTLSGLSWAIGGKRATLDHADSRKLGSNNSAAGDAMPGWILQTETDQTITTSAWVLRRAGNTTDGAITIRGASDSPRPIINQTANAACFEQIVSILSIIYDSIQITNSNGTKTAAYGIHLSGNAADLSVTNCLFGDATNTLFNGIFLGAAGNTLTISRSKIQETTDIGLRANTSNATLYVSESVIAESGSHGLAISGGAPMLHIENSLIYNNATDGINAGGNTKINRMAGNVLHGNGGDGLDWSSTNIQNTITTIVRNIFSDNGNYGVRSSAVPLMYNMIDNNAYYSNTSGTHTSFISGANDITLSADPFEDSGAGDFNINNTAGGGADLRAATVTLP